GIDQLLLAGVERVALAANFDVDLRLGVTGVDHVAAGAGNRAVHVVRMDALLHGSFTSFSIMIPGAILDICAHHNLRIAATSIHHPVRMEQPSERLLKYSSRIPRVCQEIFCTRERKRFCRKKAPGHVPRLLERDTSLELATYCLGSSHSTG